MEKNNKKVKLVSAKEEKDPKTFELFKEVNKTLVTIKYDEVGYAKRLGLLKSLDKTKLSAKENSDIQSIVVVLEAALGWEVPASGVTILHGEPYLNTTGLLYKIRQLHEKGTYGKLKSIKAEPLKDKDGNYMIATKVGDTAFFFGKVVFEVAEFEDIGEAGPSTLKANEMVPFANEMAARRATNRAMRLAVDWGATSFDEMPDAWAKETDGKSIPLTEKEMEGVADYLMGIVAAKTVGELSDIKTKLSEVKKDFSPAQLQKLAKVFNQKSEELGAIFE